MEHHAYGAVCEPYRGAVQKRRHVLCCLTAHIHISHRDGRTAAATQQPSQARSPSSPRAAEYTSEQP
eukprot:COSAG02_NODE_48667_length_332_cov_0.665236_1_plen_66_part_10